MDNDTLAKRLAQVTGVKVTGEMFTLWRNGANGERRQEVERAVSILFPCGLKEKLGDSCRKAVLWTLGGFPRKEGKEFDGLVNRLF